MWGRDERAERDPHLTAALKDVVLAMVAVIGVVNAAVKALDRSVAARLGEHPDGAIFTSLPRYRVSFNAAQVLAAWGDCRASLRTSPTSVAALAGLHTGDQSLRQTARRCTSAGPATNASGRAMTTFADNSRHAQPVGGEDLHRGPRRADTTTPTPSASSPCAWIRVIWRCWHAHTALRPQPGTEPPEHSLRIFGRPRGMRLTQGVP